MIDTKKRDELICKEFELDMKKFPVGTKVANMGRSTNDGKPQISHLTLEFESQDEKAAAKFSASKFYVGNERDDGDKYVWRVSFVRHY